MKSKEKVLVNKGIDQVKRERFEEALEFFDRVLEMNPENADALNNRGVAVYHLGRVEEAMECYSRALDADPENLEVMRNMGFILRKTGLLDDALECYDRILAKEEDPSDLRSKAAVLVGLGRIEEAIECLMVSADIGPSPQVEQEISMLRMMLVGSAEKEQQ